MLPHRVPVVAGTSTCACEVPVPEQHRLGKNKISENCMKELVKGREERTPAGRKPLMKTCQKFKVFGTLGYIGEYWDGPSLVVV